jgi:hypothetical protein
MSRHLSGVSSMAAASWTIASPRRQGLGVGVRGLAAALVSGVLLLSAAGSAQQASPGSAQQAYVVKPLAEKRLASLPPGPLFWRVETFPSMAEARAAENPTALVAEAAGKVWLFTLGPAGGAAPGGTKVAEIGPLPEVTAPQYLLRINESGGPPGSMTPEHTHPGSEAFYVLAGDITQRTPHGVSRATAGQSMAGHGADTPMVVSSSGSMDLHSLVMFVVDATRPFSSTPSIR